ncbi:MAG TPA: hypothetical protein VHR47_12915 [Bacillota bacterium]|jgi:YHS domain-containing protein|nr:hypothetical protein [Bacillota bacterium]
MGLFFWLWVIGIVFYSIRSIKKQWREMRENPTSKPFESQTVQTEPPKEEVWPEETQVVDTIQDPVCGAYITEETSVQRRIRGTVRYFCCETCAERFEQGLRNAI